MQLMTTLISKKQKVEGYLKTTETHCLESNIFMLKANVFQRQFYNPFVK